MRTPVFLTFAGGIVVGAVTATLARQVSVAPVDAREHEARHGPAPRPPELPHRLPIEPQPLGGAGRSDRIVEPTLAGSMVDAAGTGVRQAPDSEPGRERLPDAETLARMAAMAAAFRDTPRAVETDCDADTIQVRDGDDRVELSEFDYVIAVAEWSATIESTLGRHTRPPASDSELEELIRQSPFLRHRFRASRMEVASYLARVICRNVEALRDCLARRQHVRNLLAPTEAPTDAR